MVNNAYRWDKSVESKDIQSWYYLHFFTYSHVFDYGYYFGRANSTLNVGSFVTAEYNKPPLLSAINYNNSLIVSNSLGHLPFQNTGQESPLTTRHVPNSYYYMRSKGSPDGLPGSPPAIVLDNAYESIRIHANFDSFISVEDQRQYLDHKTGLLHLKANWLEFDQFGNHYLGDSIPSESFYMLSSNGNTNYFRVNDLLPIIWTTSGPCVHTAIAIVEQAEDTVFNIGPTLIESHWYAYNIVGHSSVVPDMDSFLVSLKQKANNACETIALTNNDAPLRFVPGNDDQYYKEDVLLPIQFSLKKHPQDQHVNGSGHATGIYTDGQGGVYDFDDISTVGIDNQAEFDAYLAILSDAVYVVDYILGTSEGRATPGSALGFAKMGHSSFVVTKNACDSLIGGQVFIHEYLHNAGLNHRGLGSNTFLDNSIEKSRGIMGTGLGGYYSMQIPKVEIDRKEYSLCLQGNGLGYFSDPFMVKQE